MRATQPCGYVRTRLIASPAHRALPSRGGPGAPGDLLLGRREALGDLRLALGAAPAQAPLQLLAAGRRDEDEHRLEAAAAHQARALHVNVQDAAAPRRRHVLDSLRAGWAAAWSDHGFSPARSRGLLARRPAHVSSVPDCRTREVTAVDPAGL